jgi:hypothetical protein
MAECPEKISVPVQSGIHLRRRLRLAGGDGFLQEFVYELRPFQLSDTEWVPVYCEMALSNGDVMKRLLNGYLQKR